MRFLLIIFFFISLVSCRQQVRHKSEITDEDSVKLTHYSKLFDLYQYNDQYELVIYNAVSRDEIEFSYFFSKDSADFSVPCQRIISLSSVFSGFISALSEQNKIIGVDNMHYISDSVMWELYKSGNITETGGDQGLIPEKIISMRPDLVIHSGFYEGQNHHKSTYEKSGITFIKCHNYLEESPLGRAEWIKFFGLLTGKLEIADSIFKSIEKEYFKVKDLVSDIKDKPTVLTGALFGSSWDVPSGESYTAQLISDAGGIFLWKHIKGSGRLSLSLESVIQQASQADVWINTNAFESLNEMSLSETRYKHFKPFQTEMVFNNNKQMNTGGGNAFWESGPVRPDLVLKDLVHIFHPHLMDSSSFQPEYYKKLN